MALSNRKYWNKRLKTRFRAVDDLETELSRYYATAYEAIYKDYTNLLKPYTNGKEIDFRKLKLDLESKVSNNYALNRQRALLSKIETLFNDIGATEVSSMEAVLMNNYRTNYYETLFTLEKELGKQVNFSLLSPARLRQVIKTKWSADGVEFSSRIWKDKVLLNQELRKLITESISTGRSPLSTAVLLKNATNNTLYCSKRIIRTETMAIITESDAAAYEELGIAKYEIVAAFDSRTSKVCQRQDGKVHLLSKLKIGTNAPPFHPNCRTVTIPVVEDTTPIRYAKDANGKGIKIPRNMTYKQFKEKHLIPQEN